jgi:hypothetical protein
MGEADLESLIDEAREAVIALKDELDGRAPALGAHAAKRRAVG